MTIYHLPDNVQLHLTEGKGTYILRLWDGDAGLYYPGMIGYSGPNAEALATAAADRITSASAMINTCPELN